VQGTISPNGHCKFFSARATAGDERLTVSQLVALAARAALEEGDEIDAIAEEAVAGWHEAMDPMLQPVIDLARTAQSKKEFLLGLKRLKLDKTSLARAVAVATFKARGLGDATDKV
jgi:hypothetical protein